MRICGKMRVKQVQNYGVITVCNIIRILLLGRSVANCDRCPTYKLGQLHTFYFSTVISI
jgi:hypothetical protein